MLYILHNLLIPISCYICETLRLELTRYRVIIESSNEIQQQRKQERPDEAIGRFTSNMVVMLTDISDGVNAE